MTVAEVASRAGAWGAESLERVGRALGLTADRRGLVRLAVAFGLIYLVFVTYPGRPERWLRHAYNWIGISAFLVLFGRGYQQVRALDAGGVRPTRVLVAGFVAFAAVALFIPPFHSADVHAYVNVGWLQSHYGANPYVTVPADIAGWQSDPMLSGVWKDVPCTYGFLYAALCRGVADLGGGDPAFTRLLFKLLGALGIALGAWLADATARRLGRPPSAVRLYLLLWSPYLLLHFVANAHNDLLMALCLLLGFRFAIDGRWAAVVPALVLGVLIKHVAAVAIPFAFVFLVRRHGWSRAIVGTLLGCTLVVPAAWPYAGEWSAFRWDRILGLLTSPWNSIQGALGTLYEWVTAVITPLGGTVDTARDALRVSFAGAFLAFAVWRFVRAAKRRGYDAEDLTEDALVTLFVLLCLASSAWLPWYLGMFYPAVFLLRDDHWVRRLTLWIAAAQLLAFTGVGKARVLQATVMLALPMFVYWRLTRASRESAFEAGVNRARVRPDPPRR